VISIGRTVNSFSGFFNTLINFGFRLFTDTSTQDLIVGYAQGTYDTDLDEAGNAMKYGINFSIFMRKLLNVQVPDYQYTGY
jgi:hypothetical protein